MLDETNDIAFQAVQVLEAARRAKDPGISAPFQETIAYNTRIAAKAAQGELAGMLPLPQPTEAASL